MKYPLYLDRTRNERNFWQNDDAREYWHKQCWVCRSKTFSRSFTSIYCHLKHMESSFLLALEYNVVNSDVTRVKQTHKIVTNYNHEDCIRPFRTGKTNLKPWNTTKYRWNLPKQREMSKLPQQKWVVPKKLRDVPSYFAMLTEELQT